MKKKNTHSDHCKRICIGCLSKGKSFRSFVKAKGDNLLKFRVLSQLKLDSDDLNYLPQGNLLMSIDNKTVRR